MEFKFNVSFDYVLGNQMNRFLTLSPNTHIILGFLDEVIRDTEGNDLYIYDFGNRTDNMVFF